MRGLGVYKGTKRLTFSSYLASDTWSDTSAELALFKHSALQCPLMVKLGPRYEMRRFRLLKNHFLIVRKVLTLRVVDHE